MMRLDHCCLNVRDLDRAIDFWVGHFGMKLLSRREIAASDAEIAFVGFADAPEGAMRLELTHWRAWKPEDYRDGSAFDHVAIVVDRDLRGLVERLRAAGVTVAKEPFTLGGGSGSTLAFVLDADGNWVELIERARGVNA